MKVVIFKKEGVYDYKMMWCYDDAEIKEEIGNDCVIIQDLELPVHIENEYQYLNDNLEGDDYIDNQKFIKCLEDAYNYILENILKRNRNEMGNNNHNNICS